MSSYILRHVRPANLMAWIKTNAAGSVKGTPKDSWRAYLVANGGTGQTFRDLEMSYLAAAGATGNTLHDRWLSNLAAQSGTKGPEKARSKFK